MISQHGGGYWAEIGFVVFLVVGLWALYRVLGRPDLRRPHPVALVLWLVVAVPSVLQFLWPGIFEALFRNPPLIEQGQVWRLLTYVVVQDGGLVGTVFNLVVLALALPPAIAVWRPAATVGLFVLGALVYSVPEALAWHDSGGGNSGATFFLVAATLGVRATGRRPAPITRAVIVTLVVGLLLFLVAGNSHGEAILAGLVAGAVVGLARTVTARPASTPGT